MRIDLLLYSLLLPLLVGCGTSDPDPESATFSVRACRGSDSVPAGDIFHVRINDPAVVAEAEGLIRSGEQRIITGPLLRGDGGFNAPWSWRLDPNSVEFADFTIELCDGCPHMLEDDLDYWVDTVGTYCPWSTELVERID